MADRSQREEKACASPQSQKDARNREKEDKKSDVELYPLAIFAA